MSAGKGNGGFTLVELMIVLVIGAVLLTIVIPGMQVFIKNQRMVAEVNSWVGALQLARLEAMKRGQRVTVCKSADQANCQADIDWDAGWVMFADAEPFGQVDADDTVLRVSQGANHGITVRSGGNLSRWISFSPDGALRGNTNFGSDRFRFCDDRGAAHGRSIVTVFSGRLRVEEGVPQCP